MSREIRRVPVDWQHPTEPNPYWDFQNGMRIQHDYPPSRLLTPGEQFRPLFGRSFTEAVQEWERGRQEWDAGTHSHLAFSLEYHSETGWMDHNGVTQEPNPLKVYAADGETVTREFYPKTIAEIQAVESFEDWEGSRPTPETYMPDFGVPEDELGWCLYETVSEGTPVTPVFATPEELIEHLATVGQDYKQEPMRREAAEHLVHDGYTVASMLSVGGVLLRSDEDADKIAALGH